jgi:hypothetical protein
MTKPKEKRKIVDFIILIWVVWQQYIQQATPQTYASNRRFYVSR